MRAPRQGGDVLTISTITDENGFSPKSYPLAPVAQNISYETVSDQPEAQPNQPVSVPISFHGGLAYDHYDERTGGCLVNTGILTNEPNVLRAPVKVNTVTLTGAASPPMYFFEAGAPNATITYDAVSSDSVASGTSLTLSHTVGTGSDRILVLGLSADDDLVGTPPTRGAQLFTSLGIYGSGDRQVQLWYLVNPTSGAADISVSWTKNQNVVGGATSWSNVAQAAPFGTVAATGGASGTTATVDVASATGEVVVDAMYAETSPTVGASQTQRYNLAADSAVYGAGSSEPGAATVTMSWTFTNSIWRIIAAPLKPSNAPVLYAESVESGEINLYKVSMNDANFGTLLNTKTWSAISTPPQGRPAEWNDGTNTYWRVPLGDSDLIDSLTATAASTSNDTWSGGTDADARHLRVVKNQLYRTTGANEVSILARGSDPETEANWGGEFYMGDAGCNITDIATVGGLAYPVKEDGLYEFDGIAEAVNVLPEIGIAERNGQGLSYGRGGFFVPGVASLYWTRTGEPIGPDSYDERHAANDPSISAGQYLKHGRWMGTASYNGHFYGLYVNSVGTSALVVWGYPVGDEWRYYALASVTADFEDFHGVYVSETSKFSASEVRPCFWFANGNDVSYIWLDKNGAPMLRRGDIDLAASATVISGRIDFDYPRVPKQLKFISGWAEDFSATANDHKFQLGVYRDGSTTENVGTAITGDDSDAPDGYFTKFWTQDTNDTCRALLFEALWTGGGSLTDQDGPRLRDIQLHAILLPAVTRVWTFLVEAKDNGKTAKLTRTEMEGYTNDLLKYELPDGDSFNGVLTDIRMLRANEVRELAVNRDAQGKALPLPQYIMAATVREMPSS